MLKPSILSSATYPHRPLNVVQAPAQPFVERAQLVLVVGIVQAEHRLRVLNRRKSFHGTAADALRRRIRGDEIGMIALEILKLPQELIELGVGNLGVLVNVIAFFVMADLGIICGVSSGSIGSGRRRESHSNQRPD